MVRSLMNHDCILGVFLKILTHKTTPESRHGFIFWAWWDAWIDLVSLSGIFVCFIFMIFMANMTI